MKSLLKQGRTRPLRLFLTLFQVAVGALAIMVALSSLYSVRKATVDAESFDFIAGRSDGTKGYMIFDPTDLAELKADSPDIEALSIYSTAWGITKVSHENRFYEFTQNAYVDSGYFDAAGVKVTRGSTFTQEDEQQQSNVMLISDSAADVLFGDEDPAGQTLSVTSDLNDGNNLPEPFQVVGTFAETTDAYQSYVYLPYWKLAPDQGSEVLAVLAKQGRGPEAKEQLSATANRVYGHLAPSLGEDPDKLFYVKAKNEDLIKQLNIVLGIFGFFGAVACIVGAVGVVSIMTVNILERERDMGIKRALGATKANLVSELVTESVLLSVIGGLLGVLVAAFVIPLFTGQAGEALFAGISLRWQPQAALWVIGLTLIVGALAGLPPALQGMRQSIVGALRDA